MASSLHPLTGRPSRKAGVLSRSEARLCLVLAAVLIVPIGLTLASAPKLAREARAYDRARALGLQTADRSGWREEPAVVLDEWMTRGRSKTWKIQLALRDGEKQTILMSRTNLRRYIAPGSPVRAQFWHGKITRLQFGGRQAATWADPDWLLYNNRVGTVGCSLLLLVILMPLISRVRPRVGFQIRVSHR